MKSGFVRNRNVVPVERYPSAWRHDQVGGPGIRVVIHCPPADGLLRLAPDHDRIGVAGGHGDRLGKALEVADLDFPELEQEALR
jgi:hypothetical protein